MYIPGGWGGKTEGEKRKSKKGRGEQIGKGVKEGDTVRQKISLFQGHGIVV